MTTERLVREALGKSVTLLDLCVCGALGVFGAGWWCGACGTGSCRRHACRGTVALAHTRERCAALCALRRTAAPDNQAASNHHGDHANHDHRAAWQAAVLAARPMPVPRPRGHAVSAVYGLGPELDEDLLFAALWGFGARLCALLLDHARTTLAAAEPPQCTRLRRGASPGHGDGLFVTEPVCAGAVLLVEQGLVHHGECRAAAVLAVLATADPAELARLRAQFPAPAPRRGGVPALPPDFVPWDQYDAIAHAARATCFGSGGSDGGDGDGAVAHFPTGRLINHACGDHANATWDWAPQTPGPCVVNTDDTSGGWPVGTLHVVATRGMAAGDEVLIDYYPGHGPPTVRGGFAFDCSCPGCRSTASP